MKNLSRDELAEKYLEIFRKSKEPLAHHVIGGTLGLNEMDSYEVIRVLKKRDLIQKVGAAKNSKWMLLKKTK